MPENLTSQPWWVAVIGGLLFTIRWLIGFGASSSKAIIASQQEEMDRLNARVDKLEERERESLELIEELRMQNGLLRQALDYRGSDQSEISRAVHVSGGIRCPSHEHQ